MFSPFLRPSIIKRDANFACELFFYDIFFKGLNDFSTASQANASVKVFAYSLKTSTGTLCKHLFTNHIKDWISECARLEIPITAQKAVDAINAYQGTRPTSKTPRPQFTSGNFIDALVEFIVATDQVHFEDSTLFYF